MNSVVGLTGLVKIELPDHTIRLCDGGFFPHAGETYRSKDSIYGTIGGIETMAEGAGDTVPAIVLQMFPPETSAAADISKPGNQKATVTFSIAEFNVETREITSATVEFNGQIDQTVLSASDDSRILTITVTSLAERMLEGNIGNSLNSSWQKYVYGANELGNDFAVNLPLEVAWGTETPGNSSVAKKGGGSNVFSVLGGAIFKLF